RAPAGARFADTLAMPEREIQSAPEPPAAAYAPAHVHIPLVARRARPDRPGADAIPLQGLLRGRTGFQLHPAPRRSAIDAAVLRSRVRGLDRGGRERDPGDAARPESRPGPRARVDRDGRPRPLRQRALVRQEHVLLP